MIIGIIGIMARNAFPPLTILIKDLHLHSHSAFSPFIIMLRLSHYHPFYFLLLTILSQIYHPFYNHPPPITVTHSNNHTTTIILNQLP